MYARRQTNIRITIAAITIGLFCIAGTAFAQSDPRPTPNVPPAAGTGTPPPASTGTLSRDGVFSCRNAGYANIGTTVVRGGIYVPVRDADVILNTGYLVYKECVLDGVVSMIKNDVAAGVQSNAIKAVERSRGGQQQYFTNSEDLRPYLNVIFTEATLAARSGTMCNAFKNRVPTAVARNYLATTQKPGDELICPFIQSEAERQALISGSEPVNWNSWSKFVDPRSYEFGVYYLEKGQADTQMANYNYNIREMINNGNGFFPAFDNASNPLNQRVITPGYVIAQSLVKLLGVGTDILVNANEIDQINGSLQAGLQGSIVADTIRGLTGFSRSQNGQPSYLDRMSAEASASVRNAAVNAALITLATVRQIETNFKSAKEGIAQILIDAVNKLRAAENACWDRIIPAAQSRGAIRVATTTEFSQAAVDAQLRQLMQQTESDLRISTQALNVINQLIANVTNSNSTTVQQQALLQLDSMVANNQLHSAADAERAQKQRDDVSGAITGLVDQTIKDWSESEDPTIGWCNINNPAVVDRWYNEWRI